MVRKSNKTLGRKENHRNIGEEILYAIRNVKASRYGSKYRVAANDIIKTRIKCGLTQAEFATALRISMRTLQQWEQERRQPSSIAKTLLKIIERHPEILQELLAQGQGGIEQKIKYTNEPMKAKIIKDFLPSAEELAFGQSSKA